MSTEKAKKLILSMRWYHLGFAFVWAVAFTGLLAPPDPELSSYGLYRLCEQVSVIATVTVSVVIERKYVLFSTKLAILSGFLLACGSLLFLVALQTPLLQEVCFIMSGLAVGIAVGFFCVMWQQFYASEGASRTAVYIPLSALLSVAITALLNIFSQPVLVVLFVVLFPCGAAVSLVKCFHEIKVSDFVPYMNGEKVVKTIRSLWKPVFCACSIGFVWKLLSHLLSQPGSYSTAPTLGGLTLAVGVVVLIELFSESGFEVMRLYQVLFPVLTGVFLLPTLFGPEYMPILTGMLLFGFEIVNLLLIVTCAVYSSENNLPSTSVYALCVGPTLVAMLAGETVGTELNLYVAYDFAYIINIMFVCIYLLSMVFLFITSIRRRKDRVSRTPTESFPDVAVVGAMVEDLSGNGFISSELSMNRESTIPRGSNVVDLPEMVERKVDSHILANPLSKREREIVCLMLRGNNVPAIARKLYLSENTVRDHVKSIYVKASVHSRQELIDMFD